MHAVDFTFVVEANNEIDFVEITHLLQQATYRKSSGFKSPFRDTLRFSHETAFESIGLNLRYLLKVQDKKGLTFQDTLSIQVDSSRVEIMVKDVNGQPFQRKLKVGLTEYLWIQATSTSSLFSLKVESVNKDDIHEIIFYKNNIQWNGHILSGQFFEKILEVKPTPEIKHYLITVEDNARVIKTQKVEVE
ncbi:MAG: hypothetical protein OHK0038_17530 [Flammeovirgaceae bacterium]